MTRAALRLAELVPAWLSGWILALSAALPAVGESHFVQWKGQRVSTTALPAEFPSAALPAIETWAGWADVHGYRLELHASGRALLVTASNHRSTRWMRQVDGALDLLDEQLPAPERATAPDAPDVATPKGAGIPEDPNGPPAGAKTSLGSAAASDSQSWGSGSRALDSETFVLFLLRDEADHRALLESLVAIAPYLGPWAATAPRFPGFALEEPLAGAVVLGAAGQEEWDPENELVHRAAELSLLRRFGRQPYWLLQGWAWHVELVQRRSIYCFPYRSSFVGVGEHGGWDKLLTQDHAPDGTPTINDVTALQRGHWDDRAARHAWGTVAFLDRHHRTGLVEILEALRTAWDRGSRRELGAGRWERDPRFELPAEEQLRILSEHAAPDFLTELGRFFAKRSAYRAPR